MLNYLKMFFQFLKSKKYITGTLIALLMFSFTSVFAEEEIPLVTEDATPTEIITGDAVSLSDTTSAVNTNEELTTNDPQLTTDPESFPKSDSGEPQVRLEETEITNENGAVVENNVETTAETGSNSGGGGSGTIITTGDSLASANVVNVVNTNIIDSSGFFFLLNALFGQIGTIDIRQAMINASSSAPTLTSLCPTALCNATTTSITEIENINTAEVVNNVVVRSSTGGNSASGDGSTINTGDAYAAANVVNVVNTNIIDSNYALMVFNNFGNWGGDFILPNKDFFDKFFLKKQSVFKSDSGFPQVRVGETDITISNQNEASVENNVETVADTGDNSVAGSDSGISTGDATASSNVHNQVNTNLFGGKSLRILFRITGNWSGNIFGLPKGVQWRQTSQGVEIFGDEGLEDFNEVQPSSPTASTTVNVSNDNTASITNNVSVYALTGENKIEGSDSEISTGNALAVANVVNLANTNVVGQNWLYAIFNIFGDWNGNVSFGEPDLWLGARAESLSGNFSPGARVAYHFTVANRGDADATKVKIKNIFDSDFITFDEDNETEWDIGAVPSGSSADFTYIATIADNLPFGDTELKSGATALAFENDANPEDNTDQVAIVASRARPSPVYNGLNVPFTPDPILSVTKTNDASTTTTPLTASSTVKYQVVIKNDGGEAYRAVLVDTLKNEKDEVINEQSWDLDVIFPNEEITVDYTVFFNASTTDGVYTNYAQVKALGRHPSLNPFYGWFADSNIATSSITIANPKPEPAPEPWVYLSPPDPSYVPPALQTEEIKREIKPPPPKPEASAFPPLQSFQPFDPDFFGKMVFIFRPSYNLSQTAAVFAGLPFVTIPRNLSILFLLIIGAALITSQREPVRKLRNAFNSFLS